MQASAKRRVAWMYHISQLISSKDRPHDQLRHAIYRNRQKSEYTTFFCGTLSVALSTYQYQENRSKFPARGDRGVKEVAELIVRSVTDVLIAFAHGRGGTRVHVAGVTAEYRVFTTSSVNGLHWLEKVYGRHHDI
eukprot:scaffold7120_cov49-Cyclotella_meneghiniana.AAC.3